MSTDTVTIGCKLHNGYILEVGYQLTGKTADGKTVARYMREPNYKRVVLKGSNAHNQAGIQTPMSVARVYLNRGVPKDFWDQWLKEHKSSYFVRNGIIFEAKTEAEAQLKAIESEGAPPVLEPLDKSKMIVPGIAPRTEDEAA
jgi:hypothetical protein